MSKLAVKATLMLVAALGDRRSRGGHEPAIAHSLRVAEAFSQHSPLRVIALLHDVFEEGDVIIDDAKMFRTFGPLITDAVYALTRVDGETYRDYILRVRRNPWARAVKEADINDNLQRAYLLPEAEAASLSGRWVKALQTLREG